MIRSPATVCAAASNAAAAPTTGVQRWDRDAQAWQDVPAAADAGSGWLSAAVRKPGLYRVGEVAAEARRDASALSNYPNPFNAGPGATRLPGAGDPAGPVRGAGRLAGGTLPHRFLAATAARADLHVRDPPLLRAPQERGGHRLEGARAPQLGLGLDDLVEIVEEPGIDEGFLGDLGNGHPAKKRVADREDAVGGGNAQPVQDRVPRRHPFPQRRTLRVRAKTEPPGLPRAQRLRPRFLAGPAQRE